MEITSGEAVRSPVSDEVNRPQDEPDNAGQGLLERAFARENLKRAWKRVKANKGAAGVDGLDMNRLPNVCCANGLRFVNSSFQAPTGPVR